MPRWRSLVDLVYVREGLSLENSEILAKSVFMTWSIYTQICLKLGRHHRDGWIELMRYNVNNIRYITAHTRLDHIYTGDWVEKRVIRCAMKGEIHILQHFAERSVMMTKLNGLCKMTTRNELNLAVLKLFKMQNQQREEKQNDMTRIKQLLSTNYEMTNERPNEMRFTWSQHQ